MLKHAGQCFSLWLAGFHFQLEIWSDTIYEKMDQPSLRHFRQCFKTTDGKWGHFPFKVEGVRIFMFEDRMLLSIK